MSNKKQHKRDRPERRIRVRGVQHDTPDIKKLSQAVLALAIAQAEKDAQAQKERGSQESA